MESRGSKWLYKDLTQEIIGAAMEVHRELGPGFLEYVYEEALCYELKLRKISFDRQSELDIYYKDFRHLENSTKNGSVNIGFCPSKTL